MDLLQATIFLVCLLSAITLLEGRSVFLLGGQSNMVGQGGFSNESFIWDGVIPPECQRRPRILRLNNNSMWEEARELLHRDIWPTNIHCGIGPGMPFATTTLDSRPDIDIGLVPCAVAGSNITEWARGTDFYERMLSRAAAAVAGGSGRIAALLWYQGEAETNREVDARSYRQRLVQFFNDLRSDLGSPNLPIIQVALVKAGKFTQIVRETQLNLGLPHVYCVDAVKLNLTREFDGIHLTTDSQVTLGKEMARVFLNVSAGLV